MRLSRKSLEILYLSFVRPILEYGSVVWDGCTSSESEQLENVQLAAARVITGAIRGTKHHLIYDESGLEKLSERRTKSKLTLFYKIVHGLASMYLQNLLPNYVQDRNCFACLADQGPFKFGPEPLQGLLSLVCY